MNKIDSYVPEYGYWYDHDTGQYYYYNEKGVKFVSNDGVEWEVENGISY